jgi:hypothetical protein
MRSAKRRESLRFCQRGNAHPSSRAGEAARAVSIVLAIVCGNRRAVGDRSEARSSAWRRRVLEWARVVTRRRLGTRLRASASVHLSQSHRRGSRVRGSPRARARPCAVMTAPLHSHSSRIEADGSGLAAASSYLVADEQAEGAAVARNGWRTSGRGDPRSERLKMALPAKPAGRAGYIAAGRFGITRAVAREARSMIARLAATRSRMLENRATSRIRANESTWAK